VVAISSFEQFGMGVFKKGDQFFVGVAGIKKAFALFHMDFLGVVLGQETGIFNGYFGIVAILGAGRAKATPKAFCWIKAFQPAGEEGAVWLGQNDSAAKANPGIFGINFEAGAVPDFFA